jgi:hypothetical protein
MTPRPFLCVFVAPWHDFVSVAGGAIVKMSARCKSVLDKMMRIYGVLVGSARKIVCFLRARAHTFYAYLWHFGTARVFLSEISDFNAFLWALLRVGAPHV